MKTIEELYNEVMASDELKKEFISLKPEQVQEFAAKHGCKATLDEIRAFLTEKSSAFGALSDDEIEQAAGGKSEHAMEAFVSTITVGIVCGITAAISAIAGNAGTAIENDGMLCESDGKNVFNS